ncbi:MAG: ATP-binding cassette domain-containing protein [Proteobacteria bacterium]|nr:ATP-binding cassette domain-containing protein [Pseudomonadota bacterium]
MLKADIQIRYETLRIDSGFAVPEGTGAALMGPSGSGKSSILSVIAGFYQAAHSEIYFRDQRLDTLKPAQRPLTILFQDHNLFPHLNVWKNIAIGLNPKLKLTPEQAIQVEASLDWMGLSGMQNRLPATLSGGQQQRVALARCLVRNKPLLLLDEPFSGLDESRQQEMRELIKKLMREKNLTLLLATHQSEDARQLCDQVIEVEAVE